MSSVSRFRSSSGYPPNANSSIGSTCLGTDGKDQLGRELAGSRIIDYIGVTHQSAGNAFEQDILGAQFHPSSSRDSSRPISCSRVAITATCDVIASATSADNPSLSTYSAVSRLMALLGRLAPSSRARMFSTASTCCVREHTGRNLLCSNCLLCRQM